MRTTVTESTTVTAQAQAKKEDNPSFFSKEGDGGVFAPEKPFFSHYGVSGDSFFRPEPQAQTSFIQAKSNFGLPNVPYIRENGGTIDKVVSQNATQTVQTTLIPRAQHLASPVKKTSTPAIQLSPLSDQAKTTWENNKDKGKIFDLLRANGPTSDFDLYDFIKSIFPDGTDDLWLATAIISHGPEPLWPGGHLAERHRRATANKWAPEPGNIEGTLGKSSSGKHDVKAYFFPGQTDNRALVISGVHGSELSGVAVAETLLQQLSVNKTPPYYSVIIVPRLFPDNIETAENAPAQIGTASNTGRYTCGKNSCEPNRQMPALGKAYDESMTKAASGQTIEQENIYLLNLVQRFKPARIASLHATRKLDNAGIYADPRADAFPQSSGPNKGQHHALGFDSDERLALEMAKKAKAGGAKVPGNKLDTSAPNAIYPLDPAAAKAGDPQKREERTGTSFGAWGTTAVCDTTNTANNRPAIRVITVEVQTSKRSQDYKNAIEQANRQQEIEAHATAIREIFLGPTEVETATDPCAKAKSTATSP